MMEKVALNVVERSKSGKGVARSLRRSGFIPAVVYRAGNSQPIQIPTKELAVFITKTAGEQVIVDLNFPNNITKQAILKDYQTDPINNTLLHADFQEILATEEIIVSVHVIIKGEPIGVKQDGGILQYGLREIEIQCLPDKIPGHIDVDVSKLRLNQSIHVGDLNLGEGIKVLTDKEEVIATVTSIKEEAPTEAIETQEVVEPEVIKKGKKQEAEESK
ncbi:MAG: 50S ribosomal protein L25 [Thermodesulfovibrionales bacterium]|nr:50S ribosomal protein L25 [Thermodesulfovibrionales bacterium]